MERQKGFVLIAVLGLLVVLSLVASFIGSYAEQRLEQTSQLREQLQGRLDQEATLATLEHIIATRPLVNNAYLLAEPATAEDGGTDNTGQPRLVVDGQRYRGIGQSAFALQDEGPLLSLLAPDRDRWMSLFQSHGLSPQEAERFLDQLQDYTDKDDLRRLNGANAEDYLAQGLQPPPQRLMISPGQVFNLLDARSWREELYRLLPLVTTRSGQLHNLNTAPAEVLQTIPGVDASLAQAIVEERARKPFADLSEANTRLGRIIPLDPLAVPMQASPYLRVQIWAAGGSCRQSLWVGISSTPTSRLTPWEIDYSFAYEHEQPCRTPEQLAVPPLPQSAMDGHTP